MKYIVTKTGALVFDGEPKVYGDAKLKTGSYKDAVAELRKLKKPEFDVESEIARLSEEEALVTGKAPTPKPIETAVEEKSANVSGNNEEI